MSQKLFIKNRKGQRISVLVEQATPQRGLVFIMHGLGGFKEQPHIQTMAHVFIEHRFTVILFDATNSIGESDGSYENSTATNYYQDLEDVIVWSQQQSWHQEPFYLASHSLGGLAITVFAQRNPTRVKALAPISTVVSGKLFVENIPKEELEYWDKTGWRITKSQSKPGIEKKLNWTNFKQDILHYDLLKKAQTLTMPVLLIVGEKDTSTPPSHQQILFDKLTSKKQIHLIKNAPHTFREQQHLDQLKNIFKQWIAEIEQ